MVTPSDNHSRRQASGRRAAFALAGVLLACAVVALTTTQHPDHSGQRDASTPPVGSPAPATPSEPRKRRPARQNSAPDRSPSRPAGRDVPARVPAARRRAARAAARVAAAFARSWTRFTADPGDRQAARQVRAISTTALWAQLRQVRAPAGRYRGADRYEAIAGVSVPLAGRPLEITVSLRDRTGARQYLTVQAVSQRSRWKIAEIVL